MIKHKHMEQSVVTLNQQADCAQKILENTEVLSDFCKPGSDFRTAASAIKQAGGGPICDVILPEKRTARVFSFDALRKRRELTQSGDLKPSIYDRKIPTQTIESLYISFNTNTHFVPGTVHPRFRVHPDDRTTIQTFERICRSVAQCTDETELFRSDGFKGNFICAGGPYSNLLCRLVMQYSPKVPGDPQRGLVRCPDPWFVLPYTFICDPRFLKEKRVPDVKGVDDEPNWSIEGPGGELLHPSPQPDDELIGTDYFMALLLPNIFDLESYERGDRIVIFSGCHGVGTKVINKFLLSDEFFQMQLLRSFKESQACQLILKVARIDHSGERPEPLEISHATDDIRTAKIDLDLNPKPLKRWLGCLPYAKQLFPGTNLKAQQPISPLEPKEDEHERSSSTAEEKNIIVSKEDPSFRETAAKELRPVDNILNTDIMESELTPATCGSLDRSTLREGEDKMNREKEFRPSEVQGPHSGREQSENSSRWKRSYGSYTDDELRALTFPSKEEANKVVDLIFEDPVFKGLPADFAGRLTLIAPVESVQYFKDKSLHFSESRLVNVEELTTEEIAEQRRRHGM